MNDDTWNAWDPSTLETVRHRGVDLRPGCGVQLWPKPGADILDVALAGRLATIEALEQDLEGRVHVAVVIDDDPGKDFGMARFPGHRFFFSLDEIEPLGLPDPCEPE